MKIFKKFLEKVNPSDKTNLKNLLRLYKADQVIHCIDQSFYEKLVHIPHAKKAVLIPSISDSIKKKLEESGWTIYGMHNVPGDVEVVIVADCENFPALMRALEPIFRKNLLILPMQSEWVVPRELQESDAMYCAWKTTEFANYVARCALKGHYLEFGTFWGRSFFQNYFTLRHWLKGNFYAFDSFNGLSSPKPDETSFTGGDFSEGAYCSNEKSFLALASYLGIDKERLKVIPGFYGSTLEGVNPMAYGLIPNSVSICYIDCDLLEPTEQVLRFVTDLLEPGALVYFDDWRLCRGSLVVGERAAAINWLQSNPNFELIEFSRSSWQNQWFIFQKNFVN